MPVTYETWLVLLSIVMAIQGAYVGLSLAVQIADAAGLRRRLLLAGATASFAVAIWTMHFVGMLAVRLPFPVDYLVFPTLLSFLVCVIVVGAAVYRHQFGTSDAAAPDAVRLPHGRRHLHHALHRHERARCQRLHGPRPGLRRRQHGDRHCRVGTGALARHRPGRAPAADSFGARLRHRRFRHALHGHGRCHAGAVRDDLVRARRRCRPTFSRSSSPSSRSCVSGIFLLLLLPDYPARLRKPPRLPRAAR